MEEGILTALGTAAQGASTAQGAAAQGASTAQPITDQASPGGQRITERAAHHRAGSASSSARRTETATATRRLLARYRKASTSTLDGGRAWYPAAETFCKRLADEHGETADRVAAVFAILSPQSQLGVHVSATEAALAAAARMRGDFMGSLGIEGAVYDAVNTSYPANRRKAGRLLAGEAAERLATGPKVSEFWRACAGDRDAVALDVWALRAAFGRWVSPTARNRRVAMAAYRAAAKRTGEDARDLQAVVWLQIRGSKPADPEIFRPLDAVE